jgi:hypothetical protein
LGTIHGTVSDKRAALPGVTVTPASPALQVGRATKVTEPDGTYRLGSPVGTYKITFELPVSRRSCVTSSAAGCSSRASMRR